MFVMNTDSNFEKKADLDPRNVMNTDYNLDKMWIRILPMQKCYSDLDPSVFLIEIISILIHIKLKYMKKTE